MKEKQIKKLIEKNGRESELIVCMEEPAELIQAIAKCERSRLGDEFASDDLDNLYEEIADVKICLRLLTRLYRLDPNRIKAYERMKEARIIKRYKL